jgi:hypothetical protein
MAEHDAWDIVRDALECKRPARIPSFCMGIDWEFMLRLHHSPLAFSYEEFKELKKRGISWIPWHIGGAIKLGANMCWLITSAQRMLWLDDVSEPGFMTNGRFQMAIRTAAYEPPAGVPKRQVPTMWYVGPCFSTSVAKEHIKQYIEKQPKIGARDFKNYRKVMENCEKYYNLIVAGGTNGLWEPISLGVGMGVISRLWRKDRIFLHEIQDYLSELAAAGMDRLLKLGKPRVVMIGDDYGYNEGLLMGIDMWRDLVKPGLARHVLAAHAAGVKLVLHSCGKIESIFPDLVEIGVDGVESLSPKNNDLVALKQKFGDKIALIGTIDDTEMLRFATPAEVKANVTNAIRTLGPAGYIPGATNSLLDHPVENVVAMFEAIREYQA